MAVLGALVYVLGLAGLVFHTSLPIVTEWQERLVGAAWLVVAIGLVMVLIGLRRARGVTAPGFALAVAAGATYVAHSRHGLFTPDVAVWAGPALLAVGTIGVSLLVAGVVASAARSQDSEVVVAGLGFGSWLATLGWVSFVLNQRLAVVPEAWRARTSTVAFWAGVAGLVIAGVVVVVVIVVAGMAVASRLDAALVVGRRTIACAAGGLVGVVLLLAVDPGPHAIAALNVGSTGLLFAAATLDIGGFLVTRLDDERTDTIWGLVVVAVYVAMGGLGAGTAIVVGLIMVTAPAWFSLALAVLATVAYLVAVAAAMVAAWTAAVAFFTPYMPPPINVSPFALATATRVDVDVD